MRDRAGHASPILAVAVFIAAVGFALSPVFATGFAGFDPGQFPVVQEFWPVQPAGWAFGIWGVIYLWLVLGAGWGVLNARHDPDWTPMRLPLLISLGIGLFWIEAANRSPVLATVMIWAMALAAVTAMLRAGENAPVWQVRPVALYAGWLTAATGVGTGVLLSGYGVLPPQAAALAMLLAVLAAALAVQARRPGEWAYPAAVIWALAGVVAANLGRGTGAVIALAAIGALVLAWRMLRGVRAQG